MTGPNLQPFDLCSNAYRRLPDSQDVFALSISCICIHRNSKSDLLSQSTTCGTKWTTVYLQYYASIIDTCGN